MCDNYGHYSHRFARPKYLHDTLQVLHELALAHSESTSPLPTDSCPTTTSEHEVSQTPDVIPPPDVEMTDSTAPILYLLSSMRWMPWNSLDVSYCDFIEPSSTNTDVSTSIDIPSTSHMSPNLDDVYVNLVSYENASGSSSP